MNKTGLVLKVKKNSVTLVTGKGEFVNVLVLNYLPNIGETYTGIVKKQSSYLKYLVAAIVLFIVFLSVGGTYAYYTPVSTVQVKINPSIEIKLNRFDRVIKCSPTNKDGEKLLQNLQLKNKNIDETLILVVDKAKKDDFINDGYAEQGKTISIEILSKYSAKIIDVNKFVQYIVKNKINTSINNNGKESEQQFIKKDKNIDKEIKVNNNDEKNVNINNKTNITEEKKVEDKENNSNIKNNNTSNDNSNKELKSKKDHKLQKFFNNKPKDK